MLHSTFVYEKHEEHGTYGLAMKGRPWMEPGSGMVTAHDMLEHFPNDDGSVEHELLALGASMYVRRFDEYYCRINRSRVDVADNIAADFPTLWGYLKNDSRTLLREPKSNIRHEDDRVEETVNDCVVKAVRLCRSEFRPGEFPSFLHTSERWKVAGWLRQGYRAAVKRYRSHGSFKLCDVFCETERVVDQAIKECERNEWLGAEVRVNIDLRRCFVTYKIKGYEHEYD